MDVGLLSIPRELRDRIYEELLCLDEFQTQQHHVFHAPRKLYPAILRVNRQLYHEASEILYDANGWVTLTAVDWLISEIANTTISARTGSSDRSFSDCVGFPGDSHPVTRYKDDRLSRSAILNIKLQVTGDPTMVDRVLPLAGLPRFCRLLTRTWHVKSTDLTMQFNTHSRESHKGRLLGYIGQARGLRRVFVTGTEPPWAAASIASVMVHPYTSLVESLNTVSSYQKRSEHESSHGRTLAARALAQDGVDFIDWWLIEIRPRMESRGPKDSEEMDELLDARAHMGFSCAALHLRLGSIDLAQGAVRNVLEALSSERRLREGHKACAHYHMAQSFEAAGWKTAALYSYLQALRIRPAYGDADAAVDQMERNIGSGTALEDAKVEQNIKHVLTPFLHKASHLAVLSDREYKRIFLGFDATAAEIHSLQRHAQHEVSRLCSRALDVFLTTHRPISYT